MAGRDGRASAEARVAGDMAGRKQTQDEATRALFGAALHEFRKTYSRTVRETVRNGADVADFLAKHARPTEESLAEAEWTGPHPWDHVRRIVVCETCHSPQPADGDRSWHLDCKAACALQWHACPRYSAHHEFRVRLAAQQQAHARAIASVRRKVHGRDRANATSPVEVVNISSEEEPSESSEDEGDAEVREAEKLNRLLRSAVLSAAERGICVTLLAGRLHKAFARTPGITRKRISDISNMATEIVGQGKLLERVPIASMSTVQAWTRVSDLESAVVLRVLLDVWEQCHRLGSAATGDARPAKRHKTSPIAEHQEPVE